MDARTIVEQYLDALTRGAVDEAANYLSDDLVYEPDPNVQIPKAIYLQAVQAIHTAMPDVRYNISDWRTDGDQVTVKVGGDGTHTGMFAFPAPGFPQVAPTGNAIHLTANDWIFTVHHDQIVQLVLNLTPGGSAVDILRQMGAELAQ
jgi:predicted ester cyclase